ncbi:MAG: hypothetical protein ACQETB_05960 [Halobacteriota archaeon]
MESYTRISELRHAGQRIEVPDRARDVTVEPSERPGYLRVSYLTPVRTVPIDDHAGDDDGSDETPPYIN